MRALIIAVALCMVANSAAANTLYVTCLRYESKCTGDKCDERAERLKKDTDKKILTAQKMEKVKYVIHDTHATASVEEGDEHSIRYTPEFKFVVQKDTELLLQNKTDLGVIKEQVLIDKLTGFYSKYILHTDGSIKDVPLGKPYNAYFGWCEDTTDKH